MNDSLGSGKSTSHRESNASISPNALNDHHHNYYNHLPQQLQRESTGTMSLSVSPTLTGYPSRIYASSASAPESILNSPISIPTKSSKISSDTPLTPAAIVEKHHRAQQHQFYHRLNQTSPLGQKLPHLVDSDLFQDDPNHVKNDLYQELHPLHRSLLNDQISSRQQRLQAQAQHVLDQYKSGISDNDAIHENINDSLDLVSSPEFGIESFNIANDDSLKLIVGETFSDYDLFYGKLQIWANRNAFTAVLLRSQLPMQFESASGLGFPMDIPIQATFGCYRSGSYREPPSKRKSMDFKPDYHLEHPLHKSEEDARHKSGSKSVKTNCPFQINVRYQPKKRVYKITKVILDHNHPLDGYRMQVIEHLKTARKRAKTELHRNLDHEECSMIYYQSPVSPTEQLNRDDCTRRGIEALVESDSVPIISDSIFEDNSQSIQDNHLNANLQPYSRENQLQPQSNGHISLPSTPTADESYLYQQHFP